MKRHLRPDAVIDFCDTVTLEDQPAKLAELVLRSVCPLWRKSTSRCGRVLTLEFVTRSSIRIAEFDHWQLTREFILTSIVRLRGLPSVPSPSSLPSYRKISSHRPSRCAVLPTPSANVYRTSFVVEPEFAELRITSKTPSAHLQQLKCRTGLSMSLLMDVRESGRKGRLSKRPVRRLLWRLVVEDTPLLQICCTLDSLEAIARNHEAGLTPSDKPEAECEDQSGQWM